jgi:HlyD family secretion protein
MQIQGVSLKTRPVLKNTFNHHDNEIEDIISARPPFIVRWGIFLFFILLSGIGLICWYIQYPELVTARGRLNSINAPKQVITRTDGKLTKINIHEGDTVIVGTVLGHMESLAHPASVLKVDRQLDSMYRMMNQNQTDHLVSFLSNIGDKSFTKDLGEIQASYQTFIQAFIAFKDYLQSGFFVRKRKMLDLDMVTLQKQHDILLNQRELLTQDLTLSNETYHVNETLAKQKVISPLDLRNEKSKLISKQLSMPQINASIISNESQQNEKIKEIAELENRIQAQKGIFIQALQTMKSQVQAWQYKYLLIAPVSGVVTFAGFIQENQELRMGQPLFYVQPDNTSYYIEMNIPQYNFGKVKIGQQVLLKFQAYPFEQFGSVKGEIESISTNPTDSGYLSKVILPDGLTTNYQKTLQYQNGLNAQADIVTENMRLLERFYYNLAKQFKRT